MHRFPCVIVLALWCTGEATAQPKAGELQPDRLSFGTVHVGATLQAGFMVLTPGNDANTKFEVAAPPFVKVLRTDVSTQEYGPGNAFVRGSVDLVVDTTKVGDLQGKVSVKLGPTSATVPVSVNVKPQRKGLMRLAVVETPFQQYSTTDGAMFRPWTDLVAASPWDVSYHLVTRDQPVLQKVEIEKCDAVLLSAEAVWGLTAEDVRRVGAFAEGGGLVLLAANDFFRRTPGQANKVLTRYGLEMRDVERPGIGEQTLGKVDLDPQIVKAGIQFTHFFRASPVAIQSPATVRVLVRAANVGQRGDAFVAIAKAGKGNVVALGQSLWWNWISTSRDPSGGNAKLLRWILNNSYERRQRVIASGRPLTAAEIECHWRSLGSEDVDEVAEAMEWLKRSPEAGSLTIAFLRRHLQPEPPPDPGYLHKLIADLADDKFAVRERAQKELQQIGDVARPALQQEMKATSSAEVRRRAQNILEAPLLLPAERRQAIRAVEILEYFATANARQLLAGLANGAPGSRLTEAANAALERLANSVKPH
jgi:hypothetical protein